VNANFDSSAVNFVYGTDSNLVGATTVAGTPSPVTGGVGTSVTKSLTGLLSGTTYYFRVIATNSISTVNGTILSFTTLVPVPTITTSNIATGVGVSTATLNGSVNANFDSSAVNFVYGTDSNLSGATTVAGTPSPVTGGVGTSVTKSLTNLLSGTTYYFQVIATNSISTVNGTILSFTTDAVVPAAPTIGAATATGSTTATVAYTQPASNGGSTITRYTATSSPGGVTATLSQAGSGTIAVTGLTPGTAYTFTVTALNGIGTSLASAASSSITTDAVAPGAPTIGTATATGSTTATVAFTAPGSDGGATITTYTATSSPGGVTATLSQAGSGTIAVTGLTTGTAYTFAVTATNSAGTSLASAASNSITTVAAPTITSLNVVKGSSDGGTVVVLTGTNLLSPLSVTFGGSAGVVGAVTATSISVTTSSHAVGAVTVSVTTSAGTAVSSFTYTYIDLPATTSVSVSSITSSSARLTATVTPNFDSTAVTFEYSSNANMSGAVSMVAAGSPVSVASALEVSASGLTAGTLYYGQLRAVNSLGTVLSPIVSFTTSTPAARADISLVAGDASIVSIKLMVEHG